MSSSIILILSFCQASQATSFPSKFCPTTNPLFGSHSMTLEHAFLYKIFNDSATMNEASTSTQHTHTDRYHLNIHKFMRCENN